MTVTIVPNPDAGSDDLWVGTVDQAGRLGLRAPAARLGWAAGEKLILSVRDGALVLGTHTPAAANFGVSVVLDGRWRVQLPFGVRALHRFSPGCRVLIVAAPRDGIVAAIAVDRVLAALLVAK